MAFTIFDGQFEEWCHSWWHKIRWGEKIVRKGNDKFGSVESFCKGCARKTDGYSYGSLGTIILK